MNKLPAINNDGAPVISHAMAGTVLVAAKDYLEEYLHQENRPQGFACVYCGGLLTLILRDPSTSSPSYFKHQQGSRCGLCDYPLSLRAFNCQASLTNALIGRKSLHVNDICTSCKSEGKRFHITNFNAAAIPQGAHQIVFLTNGAPTSVLEIVTGYLKGPVRVDTPRFPTYTLGVTELENYHSLTAIDDGATLVLRLPITSMTCDACIAREENYAKMRAAGRVSDRSRAEELIKILDFESAVISLTDPPNQWPGDLKPENPNYVDLLSINFGNIGALPVKVQEMLFELDVDCLREIKNILLAQKLEKAL